MSDDSRQDSSYDDDLTLDEIGEEPPAASDTDRTQEPKKPGFIRRHKVLTGFLTLVVLIIGSVVGFGVYLNSKLSGISTYASQLNPSDRVPRVDTNKSGPQALNLLVMGADQSSAGSISQQLASGKWDPGSMRSDTIMLVHIPSNRSAIDVVSIPRDSWVPVPGYGLHKINAAFSYGGPDLAVQTVEQLTKVHIDHVVMIDWNGFRDLTTALGGVSVDIPGEGVQKLEGQAALDYVRTRKTLPNGDFDRIKRQQNFLRQVMKQTFDSVSITNIGMLTNILGIFADNTTVDSAFTPSLMRELAWQLRDIKSSTIRFMTAPYSGTGMIGDESVVYLDAQKDAPLFTALRTDQMPKYINDYQPPQLGAPNQIN